MLYEIKEANRLTHKTKKVTSSVLFQLYNDKPTNEDKVFQF